MTKKNFRVSARTLKSLGKDSIKDRFTAILEIIKNSYDADASEVYIEINDTEQLITITDNGLGMSTDDLDNKWLVIGASDKVVQNTTQNHNRRKLGEKGIGRLSCARLGNTILLKSIQDKKKFWLKVDWKKFEDSNKSLDQIKLNFNDTDSFNIEPLKNSHSGFQIIIGDLIEKWTPKDISNLESEIKNFFSPSTSNQLFTIYLKTELVSDYKEKFIKLHNTIEKTHIPEIEVFLKFDPNKKNKLNVKSRLLGGVTPRSFDLDYSNDSDADLIGKFEIQLSYFSTVKESIDLINSSMKVSTMRDYLKVNNGIKLFRDKVRVKPYGDPRHPAGDWLQLGRRRAKNPAGAGRISYTMDVFNLIGRIEITADENPLLEDNASREGVQDTVVFRKLMEIVTEIIRKMEITRHTDFISKKKPTGAVLPINNIVKSLKDNIKEAIASTEKTANTDGTINEAALSNVHTKLAEVDESIPLLEDFVSENILFRSLASVGIISTVFAHEVRGDLTDISSTLSYTTKVLEKTEDVDFTDILSVLETSYKKMNKVEMWSQLALNRIHIDKRKRKRINVKKAVTLLVKEFSELFNFFSIQYKCQMEEFSISAFPMEIDSIFVNLITNAIYACRQSKNKNRIIEISSSAEGGTFNINFEDSGIGVPKENLEKIWLPLFTTKKEGDGTGLGLTIVKNTVNDLNGEITVSKSSKYNGALFSIKFKGSSYE